MQNQSNLKTCQQDPIPSRGSREHRFLCLFLLLVAPDVPWLVTALLPSASLFFFFFPLVFLGLHSRHMEVPRLGVYLELLLLAYATATATQDLSHICDLHHSSWQRRILIPLSEARDRICHFIVSRRIHSRCATMGTPNNYF